MQDKGYVEYISRGSCIVIGDEKNVKTAVTKCKWPKNITPEALVIGNDIGRDQITIKGYLGNFRIEIGGERDEDTNIQKFWKQWDLILDLMVSSLISIEVKPIGYFRAGSNRLDIQNLIDSLDEWIGVFEKPRYFSYNQEICAHGNQGIEGCQKCLEGCPAEAISSKGDSIEVDPYLCQGCGDCASLCPTGALSYVWPGREKVLEEMLSGLRENPGNQILVRKKDGIAIPKSKNGILSIEVDSVASVGPETWLAAMAYGAGGVYLGKEGLSARSVKNIEDQMCWVNDLLTRLGFGASLVKWTEDMANDKRRQRNCGEQISPANFAPLSNKKDVLNMALAHLCKFAATDQEEICLASNAPLGDVRVDEARCTLCMSCVGSCPTQALVARNPVPGLAFVEESCTQCGLCVEVCPEDAVELVPRLLKDRGRARGLHLKQTDEPFHCIECGREFATKKMIDSVTDKLAGHVMFRSKKQIQRLMMCEACRVKDILENE